ncbi:MoxR protein [Thermosipho africanus H17ap60334]|uniref:MoxR protein n=1 Tax=Thermosipho africanus (strain TCF52B) TaxID=484019 RepID=B7IFX3_THEAB|nr:AAA family ATPase [Thermosipho africanus]ACJ74987.1 MoxR protein [Thermosipho africanus TCF52B]EKF48584.1 MoxR protein [Thermosipho africanus H17ap60334]
MKKDRTSGNFRELTRMFKNYLEVIYTLKNIILNKDDVIDAISCGFLTQTNVLLIGEPGTAKSLVINEFAKLMGFDIENGYFHYLLTKFTEPSEVLGPLNISELKKGKYVINTKNKLPEANVVFLDEVFNANSAILNSLLTLINEKKLLLGDIYKSLDDLIVIYGATNHTPTDPLLKAFYDRFPIRVLVEGVERKDYEELLDREFDIEEKNLRKDKEILFDRKESIMFSKMMNEYIMMKYFELRQNKYITDLLDRIEMLKKDKDIFISDRNLKFYVKNMIAYSMIRNESLNPNLNLEDLKFILSKIFNNEEQKYEIERYFIY